MENVKLHSHLTRLSAQTSHIYVQDLQCFLMLYVGSQFPSVHVLSLFTIREQCEFMNKYTTFTPEDALLYKYYLRLSISLTY